MDSTKSGTNAQPSPVSSQRRRSSGPIFDGLMNHKRSSNPESMARRASLHDQKPALGFFGQIWHK
ncbi:hypothetical protein F4778DRAFT_786030 [Xylariomycetidae sp. FL2044]|nr:hypothetical protein F4778DRAFT_786030 [Xylariomycetidae sp. FL2044]